MAGSGVGSCEQQQGFSAVCQMRRRDYRYRWSAQGVPLLVDKRVSISGCYTVLFH